MLAIERVMRQAHEDRRGEECRWGCPVCKEEERAQPAKMLDMWDLQDWLDDSYVRADTKEEGIAR